MWLPFSKEDQERRAQLKTNKNILSEYVEWLLEKMTTDVVEGGFDDNLIESASAL